MMIQMTMSPCSACGKPTRRSLFDERQLGIAICSYNCQKKYIDSLSVKEETRILKYFDRRIATAKKQYRYSWIIGGISLIIILVGFVTKDASVFIVGAAVAVSSAFSTRHFEDRVTALTRSRRRIAV